LYLLEDKEFSSSTCFENNSFCLICLYLIIRKF